MLITQLFNNYPASIALDKKSMQLSHLSLISAVRIRHESEFAPDNCLVRKARLKIKGRRNCYPDRGRAGRIDRGECFLFDKLPTKHLRTFPSGTLTIDCLASVFGRRRRRGRGRRRRGIVTDAPCDPGTANTP